MNEIVKTEKRHLVAFFFVLYLFRPSSFLDFKLSAVDVLRRTAGAQ